MISRWPRKPDVGLPSRPDNLGKSAGRLSVRFSLKHEFRKQRRLPASCQRATLFRLRRSNQMHDDPERVPTSKVVWRFPSNPQLFHVGLLGLANELQTERVRTDHECSTLKWAE